MQSTIVPGISMWSVWQPDRNVHFNSFFIASEQGHFVVDPLDGGDAVMEHIASAGGIAWIVVTNRDHERAARLFAGRFSAQIAASAGDAPLLSVDVARQLNAGDDINGARVLGFRGLKTPGEIALSLPDRHAVIVGDALWGNPAGSLRLMPAEKLSDPAAAILSLRTLRAQAPRHVLVGDGTCIFEYGAQALQHAFEACEDVFVHRVNLDELRMRHSGHGRYACDHAEIGLLVGAERLGYRVARLEPGKAFCPLHWHSAEEELFVVWDGTPSIRTEKATWQLRPGDLVAFPARRAGAHQLLNESNAPATVILIGNEEGERDDCFYPDSRKVLVGSGDFIVRDHPQLDYYDGE
jgi:uncharacterized cupin superfamily protein